MLGTINPEILFLQQEDQIKAGLLDMKMILKITEDTYKMLGQGQIQNPPKVHLGIPEGTEWESFFNTMPSYIGGDLNIAGIKWAAESKKNATTPGIPYGIDISILSDPVTVLPFCIQDGTIITAMRTSAVAGLQAKYCALPVRYTYDNNYFNDLYQGIPIGGYNVIIDRLFEGCDIETGVDYLEKKEYYDGLGEKIVYTGTIDSYFDYCFGKLQYRSLRFETEVLDCDNYQGNAVINYTDRETPYTRIIEHKHFEFGTQEKTVITREYPAEWTEGMEPYYPVNDAKNGALYEKYKELAKKEEKVIFGGRLGEYKYYDMDAVIASALELVKKEL